jgi:hypothetical protein
VTILIGQGSGLEVLRFWVCERSLPGLMTDAVRTAALLSTDIECQIHVKFVALPIWGHQWDVQQTNRDGNVCVLNQCLWMCNGAPGHKKCHFNC